jgi:neurotransmitter:Na+ symporter, NSS family
MQTTADRGAWGSRLGFILAAAGSAVGLGNIWGFPTQVGRGGGAAFVLMYLVCVFFICAPIMIAELAVGRHAQKDPVTSFRVIRPGSRWWIVGMLGVLAGVGILSFYSVIAGWTIGYIWIAATGAAGTGDATAAYFGSFVSNPALVLGLTLVVLGVTAMVNLGGVRGGIERVTKVLMPLLLLLLVGLAVRSVTLPGAGEGLAYYMRPNLSAAMDINVLNAALGQAFFSLSLGMGAMITYGSYLGRDSNVPQAAAWVVVLDTMVALLAGFVIFPAGFSIAGFDPSSGGPGLIFTVLPRLFDSLPGGHLFGALFFILLTVAAITSTISLLEVPVSHLIDGRGWTRRKAVWTITGFTAALAIPSALANGAVPFFSSMPGVGMSFLDLMATIWNEMALPVGGFFLALFVGHVWRADSAIKEMEIGGGKMPFASLWAFLVRWICPLAILLIIVFKIRSLLAG